MDTVFQRYDEMRFWTKIPLFSGLRLNQSGRCVDDNDVSDNEWLLDKPARLSPRLFQVPLREWHIVFHMHPATRVRKVFSKLLLIPRGRP
jgi:hypothetical protein